MMFDEEQRASSGDNGGLEFGFQAAERPAEQCR